MPFEIVLSVVYFVTLSEPTCVRQNIAYDGTEIDNDIKPSERDCQKFCLETDGCFGFTWAKNNHSCSVMSKITNQKRLNNVISGPPTCGICVKAVK
jgi:hypothetical protein